MPLRNDLLNPISADKPAGENLRYAPVYDKIKEARREDDDAPQGDWKRERKVADWPLVIKLISESLATKTKDLQLAAWLAEAMLRREGVAGLREVLELTSGSVIELDRQVEEPVELLLEGKVIARGEAVVIDGNYGLRVTEVPQPISPPVLR